MSQQTLAVELVPITRVFGNPANPRINDPAVPHVAASIRRFGWQQPIVAKRSGEVIAGHTRLKAAQQLGLAEVPVVWFEGTELEALAYSVADNRTHEFAAWDEPALGKILEFLRAEDSLDGVGFSVDEIDELIARLDADLAPGEVEDPGPGEPPETPVTRLGDFWLLGEHRLLCGDSTSADDMARLMRDDKAWLLASDSPYLVDYRSGNHPQSWHNKESTRDKHWDDYVDPDSSIAFFSGFLRTALAHCVERVAIYQWHATRRQVLMEQAWKDNGLLVHQTIIWHKARAVLTRSHFMWQHEPCFYGWPEGFMPEKDRRPPPNMTTVWPIDQVGECDGIHPTQKPLELFLRPIEYHTRPGEVVLEPFSGSGTQLVAAEKLGRRCRAMEISPAFVDVAVIRWQKATGKSAVLEGTDTTFDELANERGAA